MNKEIIINATNEIIKDFKDGLLGKVEALNRLEGIIVLINHSEIEKSSQRHELKREIMNRWYKEIEWNE